MRMLCARAQSGSSVSEVNSPVAGGTLAQVGQAAGDLLVEPGRRRRPRRPAPGPTRTAASPPGVAILKSGPYSCAIRTKPPSGSARSMSKALPSSGRGRGPGISSSGPEAASVCVVVMVGSSGPSRSSSIAVLPVGRVGVTGCGQVDLLEHPQQVEHPRERGRVRARVGGRHPPGARRRCGRGRSAVSPAPPLTRFGGVPEGAAPGRPGNCQDLPADLPVALLSRAASSRREETPSLA